MPKHRFSPTSASPLTDRNVAMRHISEVRPGDTIVHMGVMRTVCKKDIRRGFMGLTIFGDSYRMGNVLVAIVVLRNGVVTHG